MIKIYSELVRELFSDYIDKNAILETCQDR